MRWGDCSRQHYTARPCLHPPSGLTHGALCQGVHRSRMEGMAGVNRRDWRGRRTGGERGALRESSGGVARFVCGLWRERAGESASVERGGRVRHDTTTSFRDSARLPTP